MEDDLKKIIQPKTKIFLTMEDNFNFFLKKEDNLKKIMQPKTIKSKNNGCGTAPGNLVSPFYLISKPMKLVLFHTISYKGICAINEWFLNILVHGQFLHEMWTFGSKQLVNKIWTKNIHK